MNDWSHLSADDKALLDNYIKENWEDEHTFVMMLKKFAGYTIDDFIKDLKGGRIAASEPIEL
jgi:hypothetical protein